MLIVTHVFISKTKGSAVSCKPLLVGRGGFEPCKNAIIAKSMKSGV